jgi:hypothetical protein
MSEVSRRQQSVPLSQVKSQARLMSRFKGHFKASKGWLEKFVLRLFLFIVGIGFTRKYKIYYKIYDNYFLIHIYTIYITLSTSI